MPAPAAGLAGKAGARRGADGEFGFLAKVRAVVERGGRGRGVVVGIGDDCAVVEAPRRGCRLVLTTDSMVEGVHFQAGWLTPRELGVRAFRAAVSDVAAMGARPRHVLLSLEIPGTAGGFAAREALAVVRAVAAEARAVGAALVGGNVSAASRTGITVTAVGESGARPLLRRSAKAGDLVLVTGSLGGAAAGWRTLAASPATTRARAGAAAFRRPPLRLDFAAELAARRLVHAMIDVSDGLLQDLGHVADESSVAIRVDAAAVPVHRDASRWAKASHSAVEDPRGTTAATELALTGGEDYELAFTASPSRLSAIEAVAAKHGTPVSVIGVVAAGAAAVTDRDGRPFAFAAKGFDHLRPSRARGRKAR